MMENGSITVIHAVQTYAEIARVQMIAKQDTLWYG
jgi:hypothetical protein